MNDPAFGAYAGLDAVYVRRLLPILAEKIEAHGEKLAALSRREQRIARRATAMRWRGLRVDPDWTRTQLESVESEYNVARERLLDLWGFPLLSPKRGAWLQDRGARFLEATKTGMPKLTMPSATGPGTLPELAERYAKHPELGPVFADMLTIGANSNMLTNLKIIMASAANDGRAHPEIKTQAAHTGRMSIVKPALQTLKKRDPRLRGCFVADDGTLLVGADYDSQEIRIAAAYSQDPALLKIVSQGLNQHVETAKMIFGASYVDKSSVMDPMTGKTFYDAAKTLDFGMQYGIGPKKIAAQLNISYAEAKELWEAWREAYRGLVAWTEQIGRSETIINPWGRRIPADLGGPTAAATTRCRAPAGTCWATPSWPLRTQAGARRSGCRSMTSWCCKCRRTGQRKPARFCGSACSPESATSS